MDQHDQPQKSEKIFDELPTFIASSVPAGDNTSDVSKYILDDFSIYKIGEERRTDVQQQQRPPMTTFPNEKVEKILDFDDPSAFEIGSSAQQNYVDLDFDVVKPMAPLAPIAISEANPSAPEKDAFPHETPIAQNVNIASILDDELKNVKIDNVEDETFNMTDMMADSYIGDNSVTENFPSLPADITEPLLEQSSFNVNQTSQLDFSVAPASTTTTSSTGDSSNSSLNNTKIEVPVEKSSSLPLQFAVVEQLPEEFVVRTGFGEPEADIGIKLPVTESVLAPVMEESIDSPVVAESVASSVPADKAADNSSLSDILSSSLNQSPSVVASHEPESGQQAAPAPEAMSPLSTTLDDMLSGSNANDNSLDFLTDVKEPSIEQSTFNGNQELPAAPASIVPTTDWSNSLLNNTEMDFPVEKSSPVPLQFAVIEQLPEEHEEEVVVAGLGAPAPSAATTIEPEEIKQSVAPVTEAPIEPLAPTSDKSADESVSGAPADKVVVAAESSRSDIVPSSWDQPSPLMAASRVPESEPQQQAAAAAVNPASTAFDISEAPTTAVASTTATKEEAGLADKKFAADARAESLSTSTPPVSFASSPAPDTAATASTTSTIMGRKNNQYRRDNSSDEVENNGPDQVKEYVETVLGPNVAELVYWRDPKNTGIVFGIGLVILLSLTIFSVISVVAYTLLFTLLGTLSFRVYKNVLQAVQKTSEGHPFKEYLEIEIAPSQERIHEIVDSLVAHGTCFVNRLRSVLLVEDIVDSLKYLLIFWALTYIGAWFNGLTLVILAYISAFSLPKVYEQNKAQIDQYLDLVNSKITEITEKIPFLKKVPVEKKEE